MEFKRTNILAYGGSIIIPNETYDMKAIGEIEEVVKAFPEDRFVFVIGGGHLCRAMNEVGLDKIKKAGGEDNLNYGKDWLGIACSRMNAEFVRKEISKRVEGVHEEILLDPTVKLPEGPRIFFSGGWKPGWSTDYVSLKFAETGDFKIVYKISNFEYVLDAPAKGFDKSKMSEYEKLPKLSWDKLSELVGPEWFPGFNAPLDPSAVKIGKDMGKKGFKLYIGLRTELMTMLKGEEFNGSVVE